MSWGVTLGEFKTQTVLLINDSGEWTESAELTIGERAPQTLMNLTVRR